VEHLTQKQIEDYSQNRLHAAELLAASDHLAACETCRARVEAGLNVDAAFFALHDEAFGGNGQPSAHLTSEQMAAYVDKHLSGEELQFVTDHVSVCEQCAFSVNDLRAFRNEIAPSLDREYGSESPVATVVGESWGQRLRSLFRVSPVPAFGGAALAVLMLGFIGWIVWRTPREETREVVVVVPTPSVTQSPLAVPSVEVQPEPAPVVAQLNDGAGTMTLDKDGNLSGAGTLPPSYQDLVKKALTTQRIERPPNLQGLTRPPSSLMGTNEPGHEFSVLEPAGIVLMSDRPGFRWSKFEGATGYVVEIYDDQFKLVTASPEITTLSWTNTQSLPRGRVYSWQVKAIKDGQETTVPRPPAPQAKFRVLDQAKANELARAKRAYGSSHLTLALLYAEAGLLKEAEQELRTLRRTNPNSDIVRNLLRQIQQK
jgi:anti-sigma factor RsiW